MSLFENLWKRKLDKAKTDNPSDNWQIGDKIGNRYEIYKILKGGFGIVYICYDHQHKVPRALKTLQEKYLLSEDSQKLFEREALIWTELERYPYIVSARWVERLEGRLFIVLEYVAPDSQGRNTLAHYLGSISLSEILKFSIQFCYGMEYAYSKGIDAHRDIKPDNIMITSGKTVKITDFGIAKSFQEIELKEDIILDEGKHSLSIFCNKGKKICGTLPYMSPEQFDGYADSRSDIYSFAVVLYQMVSNGDFPFNGRTPIEFEILHRNGKVPQISSPLFPIISKCMEKEPSKRFQNFTMLKEELQNLLLKETGEKMSMPKIRESEPVDLSNKGLALGTLGKYQEAIACYDEAIRIDARYTGAWCNKGNALVNLGKYQEAIVCYDEAIKIDPKCADAWNNKGTTLEDIGKYDQAIMCFDEAIRTNSGFAGAWSNKGNALVNLGKYQEAIVCYDEALRINIKYTYYETLYNKGVALVNLGKHQEAIVCFDEAIKINPRFAKAWYNKGTVLADLGKHNHAIMCFDEAIRINPSDSEALYNKGNSLSCLGKHVDAITCYDETIRSNPRFAEAWYNKGITFVNLGKYQEVIPCLDEAIKLNPSNALAWYNKGVVLAILARFHEALKCADETIRLDPMFSDARILRQRIIEKLRE